VTTIWCILKEKGRNKDRKIAETALKVSLNKRTTIDRNHLLMKDNEEGQETTNSIAKIDSERIILPIKAIAINTTKGKGKQAINQTMTNIIRAKAKSTIKLKKKNTTKAKETNTTNMKEVTAKNARNQGTL
jgi:hypothetical protein